MLTEREKAELSAAGIRLEPLGDSAAIARFGETIDPQAHRRVIGLAEQLDHSPVPGMTDVVPAFASLTVHYDPIALHALHGPDVREAGGSFAYVSRCLAERIQAGGHAAAWQSRIVEIPVCYGGDLGPDLGEVAAHCGITEEEVVAIHAAGDYTAYMIGFAPGFPYLGGLSDRIATPRRATPRLAIPAGSVAIGGGQTGVYPLATPGGWRIIGRTPIRLFRPEDPIPSFLRAGDRVRFRPMKREAYDRYEEGAT
ncbi:5-oxoprolinase subunit PxpB [Paenibacillus xanthanilyticus]|uniref:5-oxoprolinase subunit PxpB n=1 Tax=Paenibacillus xanthanilyticus TaxID=1783531 RepID=A0ABV8KAK8_9BACL